MAYKWENESLQKYGEAVTQKLINDQKKYEEIHKDNDCVHCGKGNEGAIIQSESGMVFLMRYGLWSNGKCNYCGRQTRKKILTKN